MPNKNNNKNNKTRKRIPRTLLPVLAATAAYAATTPTPINPYPDTYAFCRIPEGDTKFKCDYGLDPTSEREPWVPTVHGHIYTLRGTPGADPTAVNSIGCPIDMNSRERARCKVNRSKNLNSSYRPNHLAVEPVYPHTFPEGFRFPTYEEMQLIKAADPTAPDPREPASRWQNYLEFCRMFPKICGATALIAALGLGFAVDSNKKEYNKRVLEGTRKYLQKLKNEGTKFTRTKANQGKAKPSWAPGKR
jgi:hypothetical protein